jgi:hypothetical protein
MKHVIIDRPRVGGEGGRSRPAKGTRKYLQRTPLDDQPRYESNAPHRLYGHGCKHLNEHLAPLVRWLRSQCGRNWDDVWSEICDGLSVRNATTAHVRDHADDFVQRNCTWVDGKLCDSRGLPLETRGWQRARFYVDPRDNTLRELPGKRYRRQNTTPRDWVPGKDDDHRYYLVEGVWYEVTLAPLPRGGRPVYDVLQRGRVTWRDMKPYPAWQGLTDLDCWQRYGRSVYATGKRGLGKSEIRRLKLWETTIARGHTVSA